MTQTEKNNQNEKTKNAKDMAATQSYMRISEIHDDILVLKSGGVRAVLGVSSINFNLKSEDEQNAITFSYQNFLNMLEFPVQIVVQSRKLDLEFYLDGIQNKIKDHSNELLKQQTEEYIGFVKKLLEYADIMEKKFYVIVPFDPYRSTDMSFFKKIMMSIKGKETAADIATKHKEFDYLAKNLNQRVNVVVGGLESCGLKVNQLTTKELIELFYKTYNPIESSHQKIGDIEKSALVNDEEVVDES